MKARLDYLAVDATSPDSLKPLKDKVGDGEVDGDGAGDEGGGARCQVALLRRSASRGARAQSPWRFKLLFACDVVFACLLDLT